MTILPLSRYFPPEILAFVSDRSVDFSLPNEGEPLNSQQKKFLAEQLRQAVPPLAVIRQVHGREVLAVTDQYVKQRKISEADAAVTNLSGMPLSVRTADCLSVFIFDPKTKAIGLVHAGWKGTKKRIVPAAIRLMRKKFGSRPADLKVVFGPSIRSCCYQVGEEFKKHFPREVLKRTSGLYLDLPLANRHQLRAAGVKSGNISDVELCTFCDKRFFSFRREAEKAGRMISVMMLKA